MEKINQDFDEKIRKNISKNIKLFREMRDLTQEQLAEKTGLSYSNYQKIENMVTKNPGYKNLARICYALEIPFDFLVMDTGFRMFENYNTSKLVEYIGALPDDAFNQFKELTLKIFELTQSLNDQKDQV